MKKLSFLAITLAAVALVGCKNDEKVVNSITLNKTELTIAIDETETLVATTDPVGATVTWNSNNTAVATVDSVGLVTAIKEGEATITATAGEKTAQCKVTVSVEDPEDPEDPYSEFNIDGFGLFGSEFEMIDGTDTTITLSDGEEYDCQLAYIYWYGWDGDLQYLSGSGWIGDGMFIMGGQVPVYVITSGEYEGYYVGTSYWTMGYEKDENDTIRPYNMIRGHVDGATYGDWVSYVYGDSIAPIDQDIIWSNTYGACYSTWYTSLDVCYADYGLYDGFINKAVIRDADEDEGIELAFAADVNWSSLDDDRIFGFQIDTALYNETYVEGEGGEISFTRPYNFKQVNRVFDDENVFEEYEDYLMGGEGEDEAPKYYLCSPKNIRKELPAFRGKRLPKDKLYMAR